MLVFLPRLCLRVFGSNIETEDYVTHIAGDF